MTTVDSGLLKPLRSGSRLAIGGMLIVLLGLLVDPMSKASGLLSLAATLASTWGAVLALNGLARKRGRRSLTEAAFGMALNGGALALTIIAAEHLLDRGNTWSIAIAAVGAVMLGIALLITAAVDFRAETHLMENPPEPVEGAISKPQHPGYPLRSGEPQLLRLTLIVTTVCYAALLAATFLR